MLLRVVTFFGVTFQGEGGELERNFLQGHHKQRVASDVTEHGFLIEWF